MHKSTNLMAMASVDDMTSGEDVSSLKVFPGTPIPDPPSAMVHNVGRCDGLLCKVAIREIASKKFDAQLFNQTHIARLARQSTDTLAALHQNLGDVAAQ